jgi:hypothetical protein
MDGTGNRGSGNPRNRSALTAGVIVVAVSVFLVVFAYAGGVQVTKQLLEGGGTPADASKPATVPPKATSAPQAAQPAPVAAAPATTPTPPPAATGAPAGGATNAASPASAAAARIDPAAKARMFYEQVASQLMINELVNGSFSEFAVSGVTGTGDKRSMRVAAKYRAGGAWNGTMVLERYDGYWYFTYIVRDDHTQGRVPGQPGLDMAVANTIVGQQASNQAIIKGLVDGTWTRFSVTAASGGAGTASMPIVISGPGGTRKGRIVCISKLISGTRYWFISSFQG